MSSTPKGKQSVVVDIINLLNIVPPFSITMSDFIASGDGKPLQFSQLPFNHPLYILYSSGMSHRWSDNYFLQNFRNDWSSEVYYSLCWGTSNLLALKSL